jgi:hypothetical protein
MPRSRRLYVNNWFDPRSPHVGRPAQESRFSGLSGYGRLGQGAGVWGQFGVFRRCIALSVQPIALFLVHGVRKESGSLFRETIAPMRAVNGTVVSRTKTNVGRLRSLTSDWIRSIACLVRIGVPSLQDVLQDTELRRWGTP